MQKYDEEDERWSRKKKSDNWDRSYHRVRPDEWSQYQIAPPIVIPETDTLYKFSP
jgi:hypothetical protein